ncbi:MAG TPA: 2'-5' RNA ligase family protein [Xanthobacteraceae bacterium]|nr:2'-5' RNA ligase family protein [Xanthobacteraceae bacterium]
MKLTDGLSITSRHASHPQREEPLQAYRSCYVLVKMVVALERSSLLSATPVRLFFSIFPDAPAAARIAQVARDLRCRHRLKGQPLLTTRFHSSLYGFDRCASASLAVRAKAREAAALVTAPPFRVSFNCAKGFSGREGNHPLVLTGDDGVVGLTMLYASLCTALRAVGFRPVASSAFTPHVTLLYDARRINEQEIKPIDWTVREFVLVLSLEGRTKHIPLGRWQLRG